MSSIVQGFLGSSDVYRVDSGRPLTILYAEDDPVSAKILGRTLQTLGYTSHGFENGQLALDWFKEHQPPVIISDWMMPGLDGLAFCQKVRDLNLPQYTYFIILTANAGQSNYRKAMDSGVDDFLAKPFRRDDLYVRLRVAERMIRQRWESEAKIRSLAHFPADNPNPVLQVSRTGTILYANGASVALLSNLNSGIGQELPPTLRPLIEPQQDSSHPAETELSSNQKTFSFTVTSVSHDGDVYLYGHDITARKRAEAELIAMRNRAVSQSLQDALTGIGNRVLLQQQMPETIEAARMSGRKMALILIDIDNFKEINDSYGHRVGDQVIIHVGHTLRDKLKRKDCVCRWGGDELVVLIADLEDRSAMGPICDRLMSAVKTGAVDSELPASVTLSMGFSIFPDDSDTSEGLMSRADHALYQAKADGRDCWREFKGESKALASSQNLFQRLTQTLQEEKLMAFFQPVWNVAEGKVAGVEALARWKDPDLGFIPPDVFIPLAETKGLIIQLSAQVLRHSLRAMKQWRERGHDITLSVNLSKRQLIESNFLSELRKQVDSFGLPYERIIFEVTERQSILGHAIGRQRLEEMSNLGFRLSLDDFGSGYSSFDLVGEFPFNELKIYSGLVHKMHQARGKGILQTIVEMGHTLGLTVVAEGVEKEDEVNILREMGTHKIQGYYYSKPLCPEDLMKYLDQHPAPKVAQRPGAPVEATKISF